MKYYSRLNLFKASNVQFNPETQVATSYGWWAFVKPIKTNQGKTVLVFNDFNYSASTIKHQYKLKRLLADQGIKIDRIVKSPQSLTNDHWALDAIELISNEVESLKEQIKKGKKAKNQEREILIHELSLEAAKIKKEFLK